MTLFSHTYYKDSDEGLNQDELDYRNFIRQRNRDYKVLMSKRVNNTKFAKDNQQFKDACEKVKIEPTVRQASKYRNKFGKAYNG